MKIKKNNKIVFLSIDGGGIKGVAQASFLCQLEKELKKSLYETFDGFAGTSIGSMLSTLISSHKHSAKEILEMFKDKDNLETIFKKTPLLECKTKYTGTGKESILKKLLTDSKKFKDIEKLTLIPAFNFVKNEIRIFKSNGGSVTKETNPFVYEVVNAATAAPTFFPSVNIKPEWLIDGTVGANHPGMIATTYAIKNNYETNNIYILSIGTGTGKDPNINTPEEEQKLGQESKTWGRIRWIYHNKYHNIINDFSEAHSTITNYQCNAILQENYCRINGPEITCDIDDISQKNIQKLQDIGELWYNKNKKTIKLWLDKIQ